ncbi:hypothetical protein WR25_00388 [Diploscapter pachys]|uniref:Hint domain-containing protein n=1 Tax=Diploscapter pachys TaxID=2018661 RepID=A0A2A2JZ13_9BILA|nr:hypothetical protein WR25_00388 [Diploscapter pachys]
MLQFRDVQDTIFLDSDDDNIAILKAGSDGEDGFFREGDLSRSRSRHPDSPSQQSRCPSSIDSNSCSNPMTWVGGIKQDGDGEPAYELTVTRMNCLPDPPEMENDVMIDPHSDINRILDKVPDSNSISNVQGVQTNAVEEGLNPPYQAGPAPISGVDSGAGNGGYAIAPQPEPVQQQEQYVQVGEQVIPVTQAGYYYPVSSAYACFTGDDTVQTHSGIKAMKDLRIGDSVLTIDGNSTYFTEVEYFMHRIYELVYAEHILPTDCLFQLVQHDRRLEKTKVRVTKVKRVRETGIYAPMTSTGDLLVNDIYVSCHNIIKENTITQTFMNIFAELQKMLRNYYPISQTNTDPPMSSEFFHSIIDYIIPTKF